MIEDEQYESEEEQCIDIYKLETEDPEDEIVEISTIESYHEETDLEDDFFGGSNKEKDYVEMS